MAEAPPGGGAFRPNPELRAPPSRAPGFAAAPPDRPVSPAFRAGEEGNGAHGSEGCAGRAIPLRPVRPG